MKEIIINKKQSKSARPNQLGKPPPRRDYFPYPGPKQQTTDNNNRRPAYNKNNHDNRDNNNNKPTSVTLSAKDERPTIGFSQYFLSPTPRPAFQSLGKQVLRPERWEFITKKRRTRPRNRSRKKRKFFSFFL